MTDPLSTAAVAVGKDIATGASKGIIFKYNKTNVSFYFIATPNHFIISLSSQPLRLA